MVHLTTALDPASAVPLYEQLYRSLAAEMRAGTLTAGTRMPGKRRLAAELSVSVNTVDTAYQMLAAEGYLTARERSGFTVQEYLALPQGVQPPAAPSAPTAAHPADTAPPVQFDNIVDSLCRRTLRLDGAFPHLRYRGSEVDHEVVASFVQV